MYKLKELQAELESQSFQFNHTGNMSAAVSGESQVMMNLLASLASGDLSKNEMVAMAAYFLNNKRFI